MMLQDLIPSSRIKTPLEAEDKEEVFEELVDVIVRSYGLESRDALLEALREREAKMSTGIKKGIALPHGKTDAVSGIVGAMGISRKGIDYESLDGDPVRLVIMLVSSTKEQGLHLRVLKKVASLLEYPSFYQDLLDAETPEKAYAVLRHCEEIADSQEVQ